MKQDKFFNLSKNWSRRKHGMLRIAVMFSKKSSIQNAQDAAVFAAADQAANALAQGDDGLGDLIGHERVSLFLAKVIDFGINM